MLVSVLFIIGGVILIKCGISCVIGGIGGLTGNALLKGDDDEDE